MSTFGLIEYKDASPQVRAVYDDIMATRKTDWINNFWKAIAHDPVLLKRTWESIKQIMAPGALDPLTKELLYIAVSVTNNCHYCIASHTASAFGKGMTDAMFKELQAVIGMANETNKLVRLSGRNRRALHAALAPLVHRTQCTPVLRASVSMVVRGYYGWPLRPSRIYRCSRRILSGRCERQNLPSQVRTSWHPSPKKTIF